MAKQNIVTWVTTLILVAGFGATADAARPYGNGANRVETTQAAAKKRSARLVRVRHGSSAGKLTASPVRAKLAVRRAKAEQAQAAAVEQRLLNAGPVASVLFFLASAAADMPFMAGAGLVATSITSVYWVTVTFLTYLDKRAERAQARDKTRVATP